MKNAYKPPTELVNNEESIEVDVFINEEKFDGYYSEGYWWVHYGGITVGHRKTSKDDIDGWDYKSNTQ